MASISTFTSEIISSSSITLFWDGTYSSITLEKSLNDSTYTTVTSGYTSSSYTFTNLNSNTVYYFRITPYDSAGDSGTSESLFVITPFVTAINSFGSGVATTTSIPLSWTGTYYKVMIYYKRCVDTTYEYLTTVTGAASYNVTSLTSDTSYNFYITPYNLNNESSTSSSIITAYTDYSPTITSINLGNATSSTFDLSWNGEFSFVKVQKSTDGGSHYTTDTNLLVYDPSNTSYSSSGSYTVTDLSPYTTYYFRLIPYTSNYNAGTTSSVVYGTTLMGITSFSYTSIGVNSVTFYWSGIYTKVSIKKTYNSNVYTAAIITNSASDTTATTSQSYTLTGLNSYTSYQFYLLPYNGTTSTTASSTLSITTDFSAQVNAIVDTNNITYYYIPIIFDTSGATSPYYSAALIEISTDGSIL
jgi:hypothetical protein